MDRRSLLVLAGATALPGCVVVEAPPAPPAPAAPPPPRIASLAAFATVQLVEPAQRLVRLSTEGGVFDMTFPDGRNLDRLRPGMTVVAEYDADGRPLIASSVAAARDAVPGRIRGILVAVRDGGATLVLTGPDRVPRTVAVPNEAMMAFATRLPAGADVAVTLLSF